jgi:hypothetical protein
VTAKYVAARNASGRPTLMHRIGEQFNTTICGYDMAGWSRVFFNESIDILLCKRCKRFEQAKAGLGNLGKVYRLNSKKVG